MGVKSTVSGFFIWLLLFSSPPILIVSIHSPRTDFCKFGIFFYLNPPSLVLGKIAEAEKIEVNNEDIDNGINNMTRSAGEEKQEELRKMLDTPQTRDSLRLSLKTRKTIERLAEIAKNVVDSDKETKEEEKNEQPANEQSTDE